MEVPTSSRAALALPVADQHAARLWLHALALSGTAAPTTCGVRQVRNACVWRRTACPHRTALARRPGPVCCVAQLAA